MGLNPYRPSTRHLAGLASLIFLWLISLSGPALADIIHLKNGGKIEGRVIEQTSTKIKVQTRFGSVMTLSRAQVLRIEKKKDVWDDYDQRRGKIKKNDAPGLFLLYKWCLENGLKQEAGNVLEEVLQADPNHDDAHRIMGEVKVEGKWMKPDAARAAGYTLHDGKWLTRDQFMEATGHRRWGSKWITDAEYDRLTTKMTMEKLLNMELTVANSEHFGVRTRFPQEHAERLLGYAEAAYNEFMKIIPYPEDSLKKWKRIQIYLFANQEEYQTFFDKYIWPKRYVTKESHYLYYREAGNCNFYFPHPIIALWRSPALPKFPDQAALAIHNVGHVMLHRMRKSIYPPDWLEEGLGHYVEEKIFGVCRIFTLMPGKLSRHELIVPDWRNSGDWKKRMNRLLVPGEVPPWATIMKKPLGGMTTKELAKVYVVLRMIIQKKPGTLRKFLDQATQHSWVKVFEETVGWTPEQVDEQVAEYIRANY